MRLQDVLLLAAALFASVTSLTPDSTHFTTKSASQNRTDTSSNRSIWTSAGEENEERQISGKSLPVANRLDDMGNNLLENSNLLSKVKNVNDQFIKYDDKGASVVADARKRYTDDVLALSFEAGKKRLDTKGLATKLQTQLMTKWREEDVSADAAFVYFKLNDGADPLLSRPELNIWLRYADEFAPGEKTTLFEILRKYYSDSKLSELLIAAKKVPSTEKLAQNLQNQLHLKWLDDSVSPETVLKYLMLDKEVDNIFANPQLERWVLYAIAFAKKYPGKSERTVIDMLTYHYTVTQLADMLIAARAKFSGQPTFKYFEEELFNIFHRAETTPTTVLNYLGRERTVLERYLKKIHDQGNLLLANEPILGHAYATKLREAIARYKSEQALAT